jgi:hypothetical protein
MATNKWISVKDKMPPCPKGEMDLGTEVLVWPRPKTDMCSTLSKLFYGRRATGRPDFYRYGGAYYDVTHWMPLPEGPKV